MAKVFVSYSRKDIEFAKRLTAELKKCELDFWIDWEGIPPTVDWWREIEKGIEEADVFLFLISPDSSASKVCGQEIDTAVKNAKRIIPLVARDIKGDEAPKELSHLNWIFFRQSDDFEAAFQKLLTGIHTDYEWVQQHRWLQVRALDWQRDNKDNSSLLRGKDLQDVEFQLATNSSKEPHPTDLQREYVFESRKVVDRQRRIVTSISGAGFVVMALLTVFALIQLNLSRAQQLGFQAQILLADNNANGAMLYAYQSSRIHQNKAADQVLSQIAYKNFPLGKAIYTGPVQINDAAWSPNGQLALASKDGTVILLDGNLKQQPRLLSAHTASVYSVAWSSTGQLASGSADHQVIIWDLNTGKPARILKSDSDSVYSNVAWLKNGQLVSVSKDGEVVTWDITAGKAAKTLTLQNFSNNLGGSASWSPDGKLASTSGSDVIL